MADHYVLPWPISKNSYWRIFTPKNKAGIPVGVPRLIVSREGRAYQNRVQEILRAREVVPVQGAVVLVANFFPPDRRERDQNNFCMTLLDSLQGLLFVNDSQVKEEHYRWREVVRYGKVLVSILPLAESPWNKIGLPDHQGAGDVIVSESSPIIARPPRHKSVRSD